MAQNLLPLPFVRTLECQSTKQKQTKEKENNMSETATAPAEAEVKVPALGLNGNPVVVERNGVNKGYKLFKILKGKNRKGAEYPCPDVVNETEFEETVTWLSKKLVLGIVQAWLKGVHQKIRWDCTDEKTGVFDFSKFMRKCASFDVAGLTLKAISDKIDELQAEQGVRIAKATPADFANPEWQTETVRLNTEITNYMAEWDEKKGANKEEEEVQPSVVA